MRSLLQIAAVSMATSILVVSDAFAGGGGGCGTGSVSMPEPLSLVLLGVGVGGVLLFRNRSKK
jgi:hypothetical protein